MQNKCSFIHNHFQMYASDHHVLYCIPSTSTVSICNYNNPSGGSKHKKKKRQRKQIEHLFLNHYSALCLGTGVLL